MSPWSGIYSQFIGPPKCYYPDDSDDSSYPVSERLRYAVIPAMEITRKILEEDESVGEELLS